MHPVGEISLLTATVGAGLTAGLCFAFAAFVMTVFDGPRRGAGDPRDAGGQSGDPALERDGALARAG